MRKISLKKSKCSKRIKAIMLILTMFFGWMTGIGSNDGTVYAAADGITASAGVTPYTIGGEAVIVDQDIALTGFEAGISNAKIMIRNKKAGDQLSFINNFGISGSYDNTTGVLNLTGTTTMENYQSALRTVEFSTSSSDPEDRIIDVSIGSGLYFEGTGHFYEYVSSLNISWPDALAGASAKTLYGRQGYLVTITSAEENAFVTEKVEGLGWIGAKDINDGLNPDNGDWRWVTGPEGTADGGNGTQFFTGYAGHSPTAIGYENWWSGEPNNGSGVEYVAHIFGPLATMPGWAGGAQPGEWNDFEPGRNDGAVKGYIVEYGGMDGDTPVNVQDSITIDIITSSADATLLDLTISTGTLSPDFASATVNYSARVANSVKSITVTPTANEEHATITVNGEDVTSGHESQAISLSVGANTINIVVTAEDGTTTKTYTITVRRSARSYNDSDSSSTSPEDTSQQDQDSVIVIVNGKEEDAGKVTKSDEDGIPVVTVEVNNQIIEGKIEEAIRNNPTGEGNFIQVPIVDTTFAAARVVLTGDIIKKLETNAFDVFMKRDDVEYVIPAEDFSISNVAKELGVAESALEDIKIEVKITKLDASVVEKYNEMVESNGAKLIFPPVAFEIIAKTTKTDGSTDIVEISRFNNYVERIMEIPAGEVPSKITTGIVFNPDGTYSHVPTEVFQKDGKWYARLNSLTNSNYSVIWNPVTVTSVENHWSKDVVNDLASRLVIFNPESFDPDRAITRADFAEYIVRALGLYREGSPHENRFTDVNSASERTLAILIANEYGIVSGYPDGTFKPDNLITREEAMAIYSKAMKITKLVGTDQERYQKYTDYKMVGSWAQACVKDVLSAHVFNGTTETTISPKSNLSYAQAAQAIKNLLLESKLINK